MLNIENKEGDLRKLIEACIVVVILVVVSFLVCGFGGSAVSSGDELLRPQDAKTKLAKQWVQLYGTGPESVEHYNIALNRLMTQSIGEVVSNQGKYMSDPNDPNSLASKVAENERRASDIELSTSNNVIVLRMTQKTATTQIGEILNLLTKLTKRVEELELEKRRTSRLENLIEALGGRVKKIEDTYIQKYNMNDLPIMMGGILEIKSDDPSGHNLRVTDPNS